MESSRQQIYLNVGHPQQQDQRLPQWSLEETREFLALRAELDRSFMETKRNKLLWEVISTRMGDKGFHRTPDQCKCKWKNLVTRYKGSEAMEAETNRQFPFQDNMRRIFSERMERLLSFDEGSKGKGVQVEVWSEEEEEQNTNEEVQEEKGEKKKKKRRRRKVEAGGSSGGVRSSGGRDSRQEVKKALRDFLRWQMQMEEQWLQESEAREEERRAAEREWRRAMMALSEERAVMDRRWREREDERRARQEARAERRHELVVALLTKLANNQGRM